MESFLISVSHCCVLFICIKFNAHGLAGRNSIFRSNEEGSDAMEGRANALTTLTGDSRQSGTEQRVGTLQANSGSVQTENRGFNRGTSGARGSRSASSQVYGSSFANGGSGDGSAGFSNGAQGAPTRR